MSNILTFIFSVVKQVLFQPFFFVSTLKKLVTRFPNFPDRRIRYEFYFKKYRHNKKINFWNFTNFFKVGVGEGVVFFIILKYFKQFIKDKVPNPTLLNKFFKNII